MEEKICCDYDLYDFFVVKWEMTGSNREEGMKWDADTTWARFDPAIQFKHHSSMGLKKHKHIEFTCKQF